MRPLNRKLLRDLVTHWPQVTAIIVVVALGIIMFSGPLLAQKDLRDSIEDIYRKTNYEDFSARVVVPAPKGTAESLKALPNVSAAVGRISQEAPGRVKGRNLRLRTMSVDGSGRPRKGSVNDLLLESGSYLDPAQGGSCLAEHHLAVEFGLEPGDRVKLDTGGGPVTMTVKGTVVSPEYLRLVRDRSEYVTDPAQFGVVFVTYPDAEKLFSMRGVANEFPALVRDQSRLDETMVAAGSLLKPYTVISLTSGAEQPGAATLDFEISDIGKLALFFAVLLLGVASLALYITMTQIVYSQQREIGVMRAVGYSGGSIVSHYLGYGLLLGVGGGALGVLLGYYLSRVFIGIYSDIFDLPMINASMYWWIALAGLLVALVFSVIGAVVPARHAVRMKPAVAMRTDAGVALGIHRRKGKQGLTERLGFPAWLRFALRNLSRNRRRTVLTCLGVIATLCLMVTASGGKDSLDNAVDKYLTGVLRWDVAVVWTKLVGPAQLEGVRSVDGVKYAEPFFTAPARILYGTRATDVQVQAYPRGSPMHGRYPLEGRSEPGDAEIILNRSIQRVLPVTVGDMVTVVINREALAGFATGLPSLPPTESSQTFRVAGFVAEPFGGVSYVNFEYVQDTLEKLTGQPGRFDGVVVKTDPGAQVRVADTLSKLPGAIVLSKVRMLSVFQELVGAIKTIFIIFYVMAFAMGFAVLFSMITVNLFERRREVATMRTLGAGWWRVFSFVSVETVVVVLVGLVPGLLLGRLMAWVVIEKLVSSERLAPDVVIWGVTIAIIVAAALVVMVLSELPSVRSMWKMDLAAATKQRVD